MGKRLLIIVTVLMIAGITAGWYFFVRESRYLGTSPLRAVPVETPLFIRIRNLGDFASKTVKNKSWQSLQNIPQVSNLYGDFVFIDSLIRQNIEFQNYLLHKNLIVVPGDSSKLYLLEIGSINEKNNIHSIIRNYFQSKKVESIESRFKDASIQQYVWTDHGMQKRILFCFYKGILLIGSEVNQIHMALEQTEKLSVLEDPSFLRVNNNSTENADLNIFLNHKTLPAWLSHFFVDSASAGIFHPRYANWTEVDVEQKDYQLLINGFTVADTTGIFFTDIYRHQKPSECSLISLMPAITSYFIAQTLSSTVQYFDDYQTYLNKNGKSELNREMLSDLSKELDIDIGQYLINNWTGEAAVVFTGNNLENPDDDRYLLMRVNTGTNDPMVKALKRRITVNKKSTSDPDLVDARKLDMWEMPCENFGKILGESSFRDVKTNWVTWGDGFILMGATPGSLKRYLGFLKIHEVLESKSSYLKFTSSLAKISNFYMWCAPGKALAFFDRAINPDTYQDLKSIIPSLVKMENAAWQWGYEKGMVYNTVSLNVNLSGDQKLVPFWSYALKSKISNKPVFVRYSGLSPSKELVFQDKDNCLTDLDKDGVERWRIRLDGPVIGEIKMIDYRKNGEYQLLFNTRDAIHLIDRNGTEIRNYPIQLKSGATDEISVFDYEGKKDYRYMVACRDHKVYNFDKYGKLISGWQPKITQKNVELPVRYFRVGSRDYIVYFDQNHTYILDRQGKERVKLLKEFVHSKNNISLISTDSGSSMFVTTDERGKIQLIGLDGSVKTIDVGTFTSNHNIVTIANCEGRFSDLLFLDKQTISRYTIKGELIFAGSVAGLPDESTTLSTDTSSNLIEIYWNTANGSLYLKNDGSIFDMNLPEKNTPLNIGSFGDTKGVFNILAFSPDGILSNFQSQGK